LPQSLLETQNLKNLAQLGAQARTDSIETYFASKKERICLLDPSAKQELEPADAEKFDVFLFGGILGM
jgi:ribosome biogenesis SPOUT family RNA methylase Rps3